MADDSLISKQFGPGPISGPFSSVIQSGLIPGSLPEQPMHLSGYMGTGGKLALIGKSLLEGIQRGKLSSYVISQQKSQQEFNAEAAQFQAIANDPRYSPEQRADAMQRQSQLLLRYLHPELNGAEGDGKGKKAKGDKGKDQSVGGQIKGLLGNIVDKLGGPNLPKAGENNLGWVQDQIKAIGKPQMQPQLDSAVTAIQAALEANPDLDLNKAQQLKAVQSSINTMNRLVGPDETNKRLSQLFAGRQTTQQTQQEKLQGIGVERAELQLQTEKDEREAIKKFEQQLAGPEAPPPARNASQNFTPVPKPPIAQAVPVEQRTTQQRLTDGYAPAGFDQFVGSPVAIPASIKTKTAWAVGPGDKEIAIRSGVTPLGQPFLTTADGRWVDANGLRAAGWDVQDARPVQVRQGTEKAAIYDGPNKKYQGKWIWYKTDARTGEMTPSTDGAGNFKIAKIEKGSSTATEMERVSKTLLGIDKSRDAEIARLTAARDAEVKGVRDAAAKGSYQDQKQAPAMIQDIEARFNANIQRVFDSAKSQKDNFTSMTGIRIMGDMRDQMGNQPQFAPGTNGADLTGKDDNEENF